MKASEEFTEPERELRRLLAPLSVDADSRADREALLAALPERERRPRRAYVRGIGALAAAAALVALALWMRGERSPRYPLEIASASGTRAGVLVAGSTLELSDDERARIPVPGLGHLDLEPGSRLRVAQAASGAHAFELAFGAVRADIFAAPRAFQIGTPSGIAVDLGCRYRTEVAADGSSRVDVESGRVSFETAERRVLVPAGAYVEASTARVGSPLWGDAPEALVALARALDAGAQPPADLLAAGLEAARPQDGWTLLHLLDDPREAVRNEILDALRRLVPPPPYVDVEGAARPGSDRTLWLAEVPRPR